MRITDAMRGEHGILLALFEHVDGALQRSPGVAEVRSLAQVVGAVLLTHAHHEDEFLFPALEARIGARGPLAVMRSEHEEIDAALAGAVGAAKVEVATPHLRCAIELARRHFAKEEAVIFPIADGLFDAIELERMGTRWASECGVSITLPVHAASCASGR